MNQLSLDSAGRNLEVARRQLDKAMAEAESAAQRAHADGVPETVIARTVGVNRMTVRRWLGKL